MSLESRARSWRAQRLRSLALGLLSDCSGWLAAAAGTLAAADRLVGLPRGPRLAAWALGAAALAWRARRAFVRPDWESIFGDAAREWPPTRPVLASAWALRDDPGGRGVSAELRRAHLDRADALAASLPDEPLYAWRPTRAARAGAAAGAAALLAAFLCGARGPAFERVLAPWRDAPLDRLVALLPGDAAVDWGASASIAARLTAEGRDAGLRGADLALETRGADGAWRRAEWSSVDAAGASFETGSLTGALDYRARGRGMATSARRLTAVAPPRFTSATAVVHGARGERSFVLGEDSPVKARRGDWITVRGEPDRPLSSAAMRLSGLPAPLPMRESGGRWSAGFLAQEDSYLSFVLALADGRRDPSPPAYAVAVVGDAKPAAELLSPQVPLQAGPRDSINIAWSARDDGALTKVDLVVKTGASTVRRALPVERGSDDALGDAVLPLRSYAPGTNVEFWLEAFDDASPPQSGRSESGSVQIVDSDAAHAESRAARDRALEALDRAAAAAEAASKAASEGNPDAAREAAKPLAGRWSAAAGALMAWNESMREDPRANPGLAEQAAASAESLARAGMEGLPKADAALKEGDLARAAREQAALAEQARSAAKALRDGASLQNSQDMADRAFDAERDGRELGDSVEKMAGKMTPAQAAELQKALSGVESAMEELRKAFDSLPEAEAETKAVRELPLDGAREAASALRRALQSGDAAAAAKAARELSEKLQRVAKGLRESGKRAASSRGSKARESAGKVAQAWREAVARQEKAVEAARRRENARLARTLAAQKDLLRRAQDSLDSLLASKPSPEAEREAREASRALSLGKADEAVRRLRAAAAQERLAALHDRPRAAAHESAAKQAEAAASSLERGAEAPAADPAASREAADAQAAALDKARDLRREVSAAAGVLGFLPGGPVRRVDEAVSEEDAGEKALRAGDAAEGLRRGETALAILQDGDKESGESGDSSGMGEAMSRPFEAGGTARAAPRGARGTATGRVRLPSADEYRPAKELREELERSLREPRPASQDSAIKEYFRRLAR